MVAKDVITEVACLILPDGQVGFTLPDETSRNTLHKQWRQHVGGAKVQDLMDAGAVGGWLVVKMLSSDWHKLHPKISWLASELGAKEPIKFLRG